MTPRCVGCEVSAPLRLKRERAGVYSDERSGVRIEFDGTDVWVLIIHGSWVTSEHTKAECVRVARRSLGGPA